MIAVSMRRELKLKRQGIGLIAGVDEVGRGALFGPVVAAAIILDRSCRIPGINDSKQLTPAVRTELDGEIRARCVAWSVGAIDAARIDLINIYQASREAMRDAVLRLEPRPDLVLIDALRLDLPWEVRQEAIVHGDARCTSIAAASIVAKVYRDRLMEDWDRLFPQYHLARNKGYATPEHLRSLEEFGPSPLHRKSYFPVAAASLFPIPIDKQDDSLPLFEK
jgi:ribonuclease HII